MSGAVALAENGLYVEGARPAIPEDLVGDSANPASLGARFNLADGIYSAGLRNAIPEPVIREAIQLLSRVIDLNVSLPSGRGLSHALHEGLSRQVEEWRQDHLHWPNGVGRRL